MSKRMVYFAYPIDNANLKEDHVRAIERAKKVLMEDHGTIIIYDPGDAFSVAPSSQVGPEISLINNNALDSAQAVVAWLPQGCSSIGVPMEIQRAAMHYKPVAVISDSWSWALQTGYPTVKVFPESHVDAALAWLADAESIYPEGVTIENMGVVAEREDLVPRRSYADDAGFDLFVSQDTVLPWGQFVDVPCGVKVELPDWSWGLLVGRSSTFRRRQIEVQLGVIDAGYRGELFAACIWRPEGEFAEYTKTNGVEAATTVKAGERLAQLIIIPNGTRDVTPLAVSNLGHHQRGESGFGSTGA